MGSTRGLICTVVAALLVSSAHGTYCCCCTNTDGVNIGDSFQCNQCGLTECEVGVMNCPVSGVCMETTNICDCPNVGDGSEGCTEVPDAKAQLQIADPGTGGTTDEIKVKQQQLDELKGENAKLTKEKEEWETEKAQMQKSTREITASNAAMTDQIVEASQKPNKVSESFQAAAEAPQKAATPDDKSALMPGERHRLASV